MIPAIINDRIDTADYRATFQTLSLDNIRRFFIGFGRNVIFDAQKRHATVILSDADSVYFLYLVSTHNDVPTQWLTNMLRIKIGRNDYKSDRSHIVEKAKELVRPMFGPDETEFNAAFDQVPTLEFHAASNIHVPYNKKCTAFLLNDFSEMTSSNNFYSL